MSDITEVVEPIQAQHLIGVRLREPLMRQDTRPPSRIINDATNYL